MTFTCTRMTNHFHVKGWALNFVLIERPVGTRKWPIVRLFDFGGNLSVTSWAPMEHSKAWCSVASTCSASSRTRRFSTSSSNLRSRTWETNAEQNLQTETLFCRTCAWFARSMLLYNAQDVSRDTYSNNKSKYHEGYVCFLALFPFVVKCLRI